MTTLVLLVLAVIWGALLVSWLRSRSGGPFTDSVGNFRRHLTVLEKATPGTVRPANRLYDERGRSQRAIVPAAPLRRGPAAPVRQRRVRSAYAPPAVSAARRRQSQKRRRDVFIALVAGAAGSLVLALVPGLAIMWSVQVLFDVLLGLYVALLVHLRNLAAEREIKLRYMPASRPAPERQAYDLGGAYGELELRRAAN